MPTDNDNRQTDGVPSTIQSLLDQLRVQEALYEDLCSQVNQLGAQLAIARNHLRVNRPNKVSRSQPLPK
jgi:hypothetical protein